MRLLIGDGGCPINGGHVAVGWLSPGQQLAIHSHRVVVQRCDGRSTIDFHCKKYNVFVLVIYLSFFFLSFVLVIYGQ